jgi:hypothetical protein
MSLSVSGKAAEIASAQLKLTWPNHGYATREYGTPFDITLEDGTGFTGNFLVRDEEGYTPNFVRAGWVNVAPELRRKHLGTRLTRSLGAIAQQFGCVRIESHVRSEYSFDILQSIYGADRLQFWRDNDMLNPVSQGEARHVLATAGLQEADPEHRSFGLVTRIDLRGLDTTGWEVPIDRSRQAATAD